MVETISPVVYGTRTRWVGALALHAVGATVTAAGFGALVAGAAGMLGAPWGRAGGAIVATVAVLYLVRELTGIRVPVPQLRRQVPDWWRTYFGRPLAAFLYGAGLGVGFFTFLGHGTLVVVTVGAASTGRPLWGALAMAPFGLARGLAPLVAAGSREPEDGRRLVDRLSSTSDRPRRGLNGLALAGISAAAVAVAWRSHDGWAAAGAALLAVTFAWSSIDKIGGWSRWRRALVGHAFPPSVARVATWAVPGSKPSSLRSRSRGTREPRPPSRSARSLPSPPPWCASPCATAPASPVAASVEGRSTCGWRSFRNAALAAAAVASWISASPDPRLQLPDADDSLPALLLAGALAAAVITVWRATNWLRKGSV